MTLKNGAELPADGRDSRWRFLSLLVLGLAALAVVAALVPSLLRTASIETDRRGVSPPLWLIEKDGARAYMFGSMHVLPRDTQWMTPLLNRVVSESDRLVLEASGMEDQREVFAIFESLGKNSTQSTVLKRLSAEDRPNLIKATGMAGMTTADLDPYESWAASLLLSSALIRNAGLNAGEGVEQQLTARYRKAGKPIEGLETVAEQFGHLRAMRPEDQNRFLALTAAGAEHTADQFRAMYGFWLAGDLKGLEASFAEDMEGLPALKDALLTQRNQRWVSGVEKHIAQDGTEFFAVGSAHLIGKDNLLTLLQARGFTVTRLQ